MIIECLSLRAKLVRSYLPLDRVKSNRFSRSSLTVAVSPEVLTFAYLAGNRFLGMTSSRVRSTVSEES